MNVTAATRWAVVLSCVSAVLSGVALSRGLGGENASSAGLAAPEGLRETDTEMLAQIAELRAELEDLRGSLPSTLRSPVPSATGLDGGDGDPGERAREEVPLPLEALALRDDLLRDFASFSNKDRKSALKTLGQLARSGDAQALGVLQASLLDASPGVRARAIRELSKLEDPARLEQLRAAAGDPSRSVRVAVADSLHRMPRDQAGPVLVQMLKDPKKDVVVVALRSIGHLKYAAAVPYLREHLAAKDLDLAARSASLLQKLDHKGAADGTILRILAHFATADVPARVRDVKRLRLVRAQSELQNIVDSDPNSTVRYEAQKALAKIEG